MGLLFTILQKGSAILVLLLATASWSALLGADNGISGELWKIALMGSALTITAISVLFKRDRI